MEVVRTSHHCAFAMADASSVGEARRHAGVLALQAGLDEVEAGKLAIVVTELGNNLVRHAKQGRLLLAVRDAAREVEVVAIDKGPGIPDLARCMGDGYSTGGTPGTGMGAVQRLSRDFEVHSAQPDGTVVVARIGSGSAVRRSHGQVWAAGLSVPLAGEVVCGDTFAVVVDGARAAIMVADGLGHGPDAALASSTAVDYFVQNPFRDPGEIMETVHTRLRSTRGAAVTVLQLDAAASTIRACGAGNVNARIVSGDVDRTLVMQHGTAGLQIRRPEEVKAAWPPHAMVIVFSDGLESRWGPARVIPVLSRDPAIASAVLLRDHSRGRDDATVAVIARLP